MPGFLDVAQNGSAGLLRERCGKGLGVEAEFGGNLKQRAWFGNPAAFDVMCDLQLRQYVQPAPGDRFGGEDGCRGRFGIEDGAAGVQQAVGVGRAKGLVGQLGDARVVLLDVLLVSSAVPPVMWPGTTVTGLSASISSSWAIQARRSLALWVSAVHTCKLPKMAMLPAMVRIDGIHT